MKRCIDIVLAIFVMLVLSPLGLAVAFAVMVRMGMPVFFTQNRPGLGGRPFEMIKFRTMRDLTDEAGVPKPDEERLCGFGRFLRATSLDELRSFGMCLEVR